VAQDLTAQEQVDHNPQGFGGRALASLWLAKIVVGHAHALAPLLSPLSREVAIATVAAPGIVMTQVLTISLALAQRTALGRSEAPMPMMDELTTWVVDTGAPIMDALKITEAEVRLPVSGS
jgi:hypothetical protein